MVDDRYGRDGLVTPDAVAIDLPVASVGSRGIAKVVDLLILGLAGLLIHLAQGAFGFGGFVPGWLGITLLLLLAFALQFGYPIGFETLLRGRTPGKMVLGLRVVTVEGAPIGFRHAALRAVLGAVEVTATLGAIAVISALVSARQQRLGDLVAGTVVVRERRVGRRGAPEVRTFRPPPGLEAYAAALDVSQLGPREYTTIRDVLARLPAMKAEPARRVSEDVASAVRDRVRPLPPHGLDAVRYLTCVAAAIQARSPGVGAPSETPPAGPAGEGPAPGPRTVPTWGAGRPTAPDAADAPARDDGGFAPPA